MKMGFSLVLLLLTVFSAAYSVHATTDSSGPALAQKCTETELRQCGKLGYFPEYCFKRCRHALVKLFRKYKFLTRQPKGSGNQPMNATMVPSVWGPLSTDASFLSHCENVYIDMGANLGIQIRKLFESQTYPSPLASKFAKLFGPAGEERNKKTCAIAFEMTPMHQPRLKELAHRFNERGWQTTIVAGAVGTADGLGKLSKMWGDDVEQSAQMTPGAKDNQENSIVLPIVDAAAFLRRHVINAPALPSGEKRKVFVKVDIEGMEFKIMPILINASDIICYANEWAVEWHLGMSPKELQNQKDKMLASLPSCGKVVALDDETFGRDPLPLLPLLTQSKDLEDPMGTTDIWSILAHDSFYHLLQLKNKKGEELKGTVTSPAAEAQKQWAQALKSEEIEKKEGVVPIASTRKKGLGLGSGLGLEG